MIKLPPIKFNRNIILMGALALGSVILPQLAPYFSAVSNAVSYQYNLSDNGSSPAVSVGGWGCSHIQERTSSNVID